MQWFRFVACHLSVAVVVWAITFVPPAEGAVTWPTDAQWNVVPLGGGAYGDVVSDTVTVTAAANPSPDEMNIVGDGAYPTAFWYQDADNIFFRMRIDAEPNKNTKGVWQVYLNTDADSDIDYSLQLDLDGEDQVELIEALSGGPTTWASVSPGVTLADPPHAGVDSATYSQLGPAGDGSNFDGDPDHFVDVAFPRTTYTTLTGLAGIDATEVAFASSRQHNNTNKDSPDGPYWSDNLSSAVSAHVPEPATFLIWSPLAGLGVGLGWRRKR